MSIEIEHLLSWIGSEEIAEDLITPLPVRANSDEYARNDLFLRALMLRDGPDGWERSMV
jgi:hypothetical protein